MPTMNLGTCCGPSVGLPSWAASGGWGIDTAYNYNDQPDIGARDEGNTGAWIKASGANRSRLFITGNASACGADPDVALTYGRREGKRTARPRNFNQTELAALPAPTPAVNQCELSINGTAYYVKGPDARPGAPLNIGPRI
eukprot:gene51019-43214_t